MNIADDLRLSIKIRVRLAKSHESRYNYVSIVE